VPRADNLTTCIRRLSWNLGASTSWNPQGLFRPVEVLLYLLHFKKVLNLVVFGSWSRATPNSTLTALRNVMAEPKTLYCESFLSDRLQRQDRKYKIYLSHCPIRKIRTGSEQASEKARISFFLFCHQNIPQTRQTIVCGVTSRTV